MAHLAPHPLLEGMTQEQIAVVRGELLKTSRGEYGLVGPDGTKYSKQDVAEMRKDATNQIGVATPLGMLGIPLEAPAKLLYPVPTPLRNKLPRETVGGASVTFRKITGINTTSIWASVAEASDSTSGRNSRFAMNELNKTLNFKTLEMENLLTPEAQFGANSRITPGQDFRAEDFARLSLLQVIFLGEERMLLGGNTTALAQVTGISLGSLTQLAAGAGSLSASTGYKIQVSALTLQGYYGGATGHASADALGENNCAAATTLTTAGSSAGSTSLTFTWTAIPAACAYNVFGPHASTPYYNQTVYTNVAAVTAVQASGNVPNTADKTPNALDYDGLIPNCCGGVSGVTPGYYLALPVTTTGATLTSDSAGGCNEIDVAFKYFYDIYKISPGEIWCNTAQKKKLTQIITGSSAPVYRIDVAAGDMKIKGALDVTDIPNRYMGTVVPITVHPFMPPGTILFVAYDLGPFYPNANIGQNLKVYLGWDYRSITFGLTKRAIEMGMDLNGVLVPYAPFGLGAIQCIN